MMRVVLKIVAVLYGLWAAMHLGLSIADWGLASDQDSEQLQISLMAFHSALAFLGLVAMYGLWKLRSWGRSAAIGLNLAYLTLLIANFLPVLSAQAARDTAPSLDLLIRLVVFGGLTVFLLQKKVKVEVTRGDRDK